jgi:hypothetical protein
MVFLKAGIHYIHSNKESCLKAWGHKDATGLSVLQYFVSLWGFRILSLGTLSACLATGMMTEKALALGALPFLFRLVVSKFV